MKVKKIILVSLRKKKINFLFNCDFMNVENTADKKAKIFFKDFLQNWFAIILYFLTQAFAVAVSVREKSAKFF